MKRRSFIAVLGSAAAWPLVARAQQGERMKRRYTAFAQALADLGWTDGRNVRIDLRWHADDIHQIPAIAQELVGLQPDIIATNATSATVALQRATCTIPIVFASVSEPVASGFVANLNQPGGNITGFALFETMLGGKWLELLSEIAPGLMRVAIFAPPSAITSTTRAMSAPKTTTPIFDTPHGPTTA